MPLPRRVARFNRHVTNRILGPLALRLPGFGIIVHTGRKTHRTHRTPVMVFPRPGGYVVALTYGPGSDWVLNVLAAGECTLDTRGRMLRLTRPRVYHDERRRALPAPLRWIGRLGRVSDFLEVDVDDTAAREAAIRHAG